MTKASRAVLFVAGAGLVAAWLAAAADRQPMATAAADDQDRDAASLARAEHLADDIQSQSTRLRAHLSGAPRPTISGRNPFAFDSRALRAAGRERVHAASIAGSLETALANTPPEPPPLTLSGIAEDEAGAEKPAAPARVAVLSGYGDVFLAKVGDTIASRYQVAAIGADVVEITDLLTGRTIRLGLR